MGARKAESGAINVGWKWLAGVLMSILMVGGGAWMRSQTANDDDFRGQLSELKLQVGERTGDIKAIQKDIDTIKESQKRAEIRTEKTDEKLDRLKELLQDERFKGRPRAN